MRRGYEPAERNEKGLCRERVGAAKDADKAADDLPGMKELDEADRKLAEQQKFCPQDG